LGEKKEKKTVNRSKTRDLAAGLEISSKAADIWVQTDEISCRMRMTEITTYDVPAISLAAPNSEETCETTRT